MFFFNKLSLLITIFFISKIVVAKNLEFSKKCGNYTYIVSVDIPQDPYDFTILKLYLQTLNQKKKFLYQAENAVFFDASCAKNKLGRDFFIFREHCSGSGCAENIYGLYDPIQNKFLLKPNEWEEDNDHEVIKILGLTPEIFDWDGNYFCCTQQVIEYKKKHRPPANQGLLF